MILIDSSVWIDYFRGVSNAPTEMLNRLLDRELLEIGNLILAEVLQGIDNEKSLRTAQGLLTSLTVIELGGRKIAIEAARNFRLLRTLGFTVRKTIDTIIATNCIVNRHTLLHNDKDFDPFVKHLGLRVAI